MNSSWELATIWGDVTSETRIETHCLRFWVSCRLSIADDLQASRCYKLKSPNLNACLLCMEQILAKADSGSSSLCAQKKATRNKEQLASAVLFLLRVFKTKKSPTFGRKTQIICRSYSEAARKVFRWLWLRYQRNGWTRRKIWSTLWHIHCRRVKFSCTPQLMSTLPTRWVACSLQHSVSVSNSNLRFILASPIEYENHLFSSASINVFVSLVYSQKTVSLNDFLRNGA
jgi:hypothetical protein